MFKRFLFIFISLSFTLNADLEFGVGFLATSDRRKRPEDFFYISKDQHKNAINGRIIGVFDGHGASGPEKNDGFRVAKYAQENIDLAVRNATAEHTDTERALKIAFDNIERNIPDKELCGFCGTTALVGLVKDENLFIANSGDSQALVVLKSGETIFTKPHKATPGTIEGDRIRARRGIIHNMYAFDMEGQEYVLSKRINYASEPPAVEWINEQNYTPADQHIVDCIEQNSKKLENVSLDWFVCLDDGDFFRRLGMSRSLGDFKFKSIGVISEPNIYKFPLSEIAYIIFASDGLWNGVAPDDVFNFISQERKTKSSAQLCKVLVGMSRFNGSTDDITVVGMFFN